MEHVLFLSKRVYTQNERETILRDVGLSVESIVWKLHDLYGFNISLDLVYDVMHILLLNLFKKYISSLIKGSTNDLMKQIDGVVEEVFKLSPNSVYFGQWP